MKQLLIYDLDGTLVNTLNDLTRAANETLRVLQAPPVTVEEVRRAVGQGVHELVRCCLKTEDPKVLEHAVKVFRSYYARYVLDTSRLYPGAKEVLDHFAQRRQAVLTNKPNPFATDILKALGVAHYFFQIVAGDSGFPKKPDPASVRELMRQSGAAPEGTVFVGDSSIDIETGRRAGILTVAVLGGFTDEAELAAAKPDLLVKDFPELLRVAASQSW